jgi:hypothetical protein
LAALKGGHPTVFVEGGSWNPEEAAAVDST